MGTTLCFPVDVVPVSIGITFIRPGFPTALTYLMASGEPTISWLCHSASIYGHYLVFPRRCSAGIHWDNIHQTWVSHCTDLSDGLGRADNSYTATARIVGCEPLPHNVKKNDNECDTCFLCSRLGILCYHVFKESLIESLAVRYKLATGSHVPFSPP